MDTPTQGKIDVRLGKDTFSIQIARAANSMADPSLKYEPIEEVKGVFPVDSPESLLEKYAERFIEEEDDSVEPVDISEFETPPIPPIEFEPHPSGPEKVLDHDRDSTMISHDESLEMENPWAT